MDANEIFKQMTRTNRFKQIAELKNIPASEYEGVNVLEDQTSDCPFIQALKHIAIDFDINNSDRTYRFLSNTLLTINQ